MVKRISVALIVIFLVLIGLKIIQSLPTKKSSAGLNPRDFTTNINNKYLALPKGKKIVYETLTDDGVERDVIEITGETKIVDGVKTLVYRDKVYLDDVLEEDTRDYLAQHKNGDIWYFGEDVDNYRNGILANHAGSWLSGVGGAEAGIWVKADPKVDETYKQEYLKGEAEDMVTVLSLNETVVTKYGTFTNCLKTHDWTPLDPASLENKYYCPQVQAVVMEEDLASKEKLEIVEIN